jgi:rhodanese-related sulfurtransferase
MLRSFSAFEVYQKRTQSEPSEVKQGKISGAVNIPLSQLATRLHEIPPDNAIFLYCRSGMRSKQARI